MKKHRNFLVFYSLWLGGIFLIFMVSDTAQDKNSAPMNESNAICKLTTDSKAYSERSECDENHDVNKTLRNKL